MMRNSYLILFDYLICQFVILSYISEPHHHVGILFCVFSLSFVQLLLIVM